MIEMIFFFMGISWGIQGLVFFCYLLKLECSAVQGLCFSWFVAIFVFAFF